MSLREQIASKSAGLVRRESVTLPECGETVQVRGLMAGEVQRAGQAKRAAETQIALSTEDPATGKLIWNPTKAEDLDEIAGLHPVDFTILVDASNRVSGIDRLKKLASQMDGTSSLPLPPGLAEPSGS